MKRILVISDIHYPTRIKNIDLLFKLLSKLKSIDAIIGCGDYVCDEIVQILRSEYKESYLVIGNMDQLCENLPINKTIEVENFKIGITHGAGAPFGIKKRILSEFTEKPDIIFFGHTHEQEFSKLNNITFINPGAFCSGRYCIVEFENDSFNYEMLSL